MSLLHHENFAALDRLAKAASLPAGAQNEARASNNGDGAWLQSAQSGSGLKAEASGGQARPRALQIGVPRARFRGGLEQGLTGWHLLSLDAPTVAALWTWFVARCAHIALPWIVTTAMFLAVWLLYAADRLLDGRRGDARREDELERRHRFHREHRPAFTAAMTLGVGALIPLVIAMARLPDNAFWPFAGLGAVLAGWFGVIHLARPRGSLRGTKELVPGVFFGAAVFLPTLTRAPELRPWLETAAVAFGLVCWLNCRLIDGWEHDGVGAKTPALGAVLGVACVGLAAVRLEPMTPVLLAVGLAAAGLLGLDLIAGRLDRTTLRAAADLVLLTPLAVLFWVR